MPTAIILQFVTTFGVWMLADQPRALCRVDDGLFRRDGGADLTGPNSRTDTHTDVPRCEPWRILDLVRLSRAWTPRIERRFAVRAGSADRHAAFQCHQVAPPASAPMLRPSVGSGLIISWSGMRGIVSLAAAMALPAAFPYRDLIVLTAFAVVVGTLVIQGLTLKPLLRALNLHDDDPVARELRVARERALRAGLAALANDESTVATAVRQEFAAHLTDRGADATTEGQSRSVHADLHRAAVAAARQAVLTMRANNEIGDDAFHLMEGELDWLEMAYRRNGLKRRVSRCSIEVCRQSV